MKSLVDPGRRRFLRQLLCGGLLAMGFDRHAFANTPEAVKPVLMWSKRGSAPGEFNGPIALAFNPRDELHVADTLNQRVQVFKTDGAGCDAVIGQRQVGRTGSHFASGR